jgi:hypothetical protein
MNKKIIGRVVGAVIGLAALGGMTGVADAEGSNGTGVSVWVVDTGITGISCPAVGEYGQVAAIPTGATVYYAKPSSTGNCMIDGVRYKVSTTGTPRSTDILYQQQSTTGDTFLRLFGPA